MNDTDGAFSLPVDSFDPGAEWGPTQTDVRHRLSGMFNMNLWKGFKIATNFNGNSAPPYNITTGHDDNNDTVSNDRPAGVGRNAARAADRWDVGARLSYTFGFGQRAGADGAGGPQIVMIRPGGDTPMGGFSRWRRRQAVARGALRRGHEHPQPHQLPGLQRRDDVAVLRRADVGGMRRGKLNWGRGSGFEPLRLVLTEGTEGTETIHHEDTKTNGDARRRRDCDDDEAGTTPATLMVRLVARRPRPASRLA